MFHGETAMTVTSFTDTGFMGLIFRKESLEMLDVFKSQHFSHKQIRCECLGHY